MNEVRGMNLVLKVDEHDDEGGNEKRGKLKAVVTGDITQV